MNSTFTKYYSRVSFQRTGQELVDGLKVCMTEAIRQFFEVNHFLPEVIIVYRDGVGDGMLQAVVSIYLSSSSSAAFLDVKTLQVDHEVPQVKATFQMIGEKYKPRLCVIVVKKRIHTRLFDNRTIL